MNNLDHLIAKHGIMSSFSIARKIPKNEFKLLTQKIKNSCKTKKQFDLLLKKEIIKKTNESINLGKIPGLVVPPQEKKVIKKPKQFFLDDDKRTALLSIFGASFVEKVISKKLNKDEMCFLILTIVNLLKLSDHDFKMFHQKNEEPIDDDFDDEDDDGYEE